MRVRHTFIPLLLPFVALLAGCERPLPDDPYLEMDQVEQLQAALLSGGGAPQGGGPAAVVGTGWGTLKGQIKLAEGAQYRARKPLNVNKDQSTCAPGGSAPLDRVMLVDSGTRGIQNIVIYLRKTKRVHDSMKPNSDKVLFDQKSCIFLDRVFPLRVGQVIEIKNSDPVGHNTNIAAVKGTGFNQTIPSNQSIDFSPTSSENNPVSVSCSIHPWMQAYMLPRDDGYVAVTDEQGNFEIPNLPAGEKLEFQVWHENGAGPGNSVVVDNPDLKWSSKGRFRITLAEDESRNIEVVCPENAFLQ